MPRAGSSVRWAGSTKALARSAFAVYRPHREENTPVQSLDRFIISISMLSICCVCADPVRAQTPPPASEPAPEAAPAEPPPPAAAPEAPPPAAVAPPALPAPAAPPPAPATFAEKPASEPPKDDLTSLTASGGGALNAGNTKSYQINVGADFALIRQPHGISAHVAFAYGLANNPDDATDDLVPTVRNLNAKARYDFFLSRLDAVFLATAFRWDPFAGIDRRNQGQIGYLRYFMREDKHRFWGELGYDLTSDDYGPVEGKPDAMIPPDEEAIIHSARAFVGYENKLNAALTYLGGLEVLVNVEDPSDTRVNFANALHSAISNSFQLELKLVLAYDAQVPTTDTEKLDTTVLINLIYALI
jgi:putative salt-induced outer membrane protein YdiY